MTAVTEGATLVRYLRFLVSRSFKVFYETVLEAAA